ncbi:hypothetical protein [Candidatus Uabimicrobium amorphum]|uniref:UbiC transcription regulator-associated domain-containing protein n=1 Tax=Uabimicrobium amorphum TaxID=2596890 RepID=A0A5S9IJ36_UABAM|nr:hypothetical protein [Candidatus Uabimicrobium amorphum]BBM82819.1 hypothetical protein UABAM_01162 [Candidatus Uabimicrobium amorphum]
MLNSLFTFFSKENLRYELLSGERVPVPYRDLLVHNNHMTTTLEKFYGQPIQVEVKRQQVTKSLYQRYSLLWLPKVGVVEIGIVEMDLSFFSDGICEEILHGQKPLGKILIDHKEPRDVQVDNYFKLQTCASLEKAFSLSTVFFYGRATTISCKAPIKVAEIIRPQGVKHGES